MLRGLLIVIHRGSVPTILQQWQKTKIPFVRAKYFFSAVTDVTFFICLQGVTGAQRLLFIIIHENIRESCIFRVGSLDTNHTEIYTQDALKSREK